MYIVLYIINETALHILCLVPLSEPDGSLGLKESNEHLRITVIFL